MQHAKHPSAPHSTFAMQLSATNSTEEIESQLLDQIFEMHAKVTLPVGLSTAVHQYVRAQRELETHMRGPLVLSHSEYAEVAASLPMLREQIVDFCIRYNPFA